MNADKIRVFLLLFFLLVGGRSLSAKAWRGIEPLRSTRSDVVRLFNQCSDQKEACVFTVDNEDIFILFSGGLDQGYADCAKSLPSETVIFIESRPRTALKRSELQLGRSTFTTIKLASSWDKSHSRYQGHLDKRNGLLFKTRNRDVVQVVYMPSGHISWGCSLYYDDPESFVALYQGHVPVISSILPLTPVPSDEQPFMVSATSDFPTKKGFEWSVSAGKIIAGQNTSTITIDARGLAGKVIKVSAVVQDYDLGLAATAETYLRINKKE